jgi:hypothetical protein
VIPVQTMTLWRVRLGTFGRLVELLELGGSGRAAQEPQDHTSDSSELSSCSRPRTEESPHPPPATVVGSSYVDNNTSNMLSELS